MISSPRFLGPLFSLCTPPLLWLAFPGGGEYWQLLWVALVPLLFSLAEGRGPAFALGLVTGIAHYLLQLYWIVTVLGRYGGLPIWIAVFALILLAVYMALYWGLFTYLARLLLKEHRPLVPLLGLPVLWVGLDWLRATLFTGFPWMDLGYGLAGVPPLLQLADLFGHGGLTFLVVLANTFVVLLLVHRSNLRRMAAPFLAVLIVGMTTGVYSHQRWQTVSAAISSDTDRPAMVVGVVQGNVDQSEKWLPELQRKTVSIYLDHSRTLMGTDQVPELVVWPETALPFYPALYDETWLLGRLVDESGAALLTGAPWFIRRESGVDYFNSAQLIEPGRGFARSYAKSHLVPFGEYVPMRNLLPFLAPLVETVGDFTPGEVEAPLAWRQARLGILICFESIFPDIARNWSKNGANLLVNLTNDAWYGKSSAPYHSMAMTVLRAVETRRSIVRSANTGISGFIDPLGQVHDPSPIFTAWSLARPVVLMTMETHFVRWGYLFPIGCLLAAGLLLVRSVMAAKRLADCG